MEKRFVTEKIKKSQDGEKLQVVIVHPVSEKPHRYKYLVFKK